MLNLKHSLGFPPPQAGELRERARVPGRGECGHGASTPRVPARRGATAIRRLLLLVFALHFPAAYASTLLLPDPIQAMQMALRYYALAAHAGDAKAQAQMGWLFEQGIGVGKDFAEAAKWYERAARQNDPIGLYNLGLMLLKGQGVAPDAQQAARLITGAADLNLAAAQAQLAHMYEHGIGVPADPVAAARWLRSAAELGDVPAQNNLGIKYALGQGVEQDYTEALKWFTRAAEAGNAEAQGNLGLILREGLGGVAKAPGTAAHWMALGASQGHVPSQIRLGEMFERGEGVPLSLVEAARWYGMAAAAGNADARARLAQVQAALAAPR